MSNGSRNGESEIYKTWCYHAEQVNPAKLHHTKGIRNGKLNFSLSLQKQKVHTISSTNPKINKRSEK